MHRALTATLALALATGATLGMTSSASAATATGSTYTVTDTNSCNSFLAAISDSDGQASESGTLSECYVFNSTLPSGDTLVVTGDWALRPQASAPGFVNDGTINVTNSTNFSDGFYLAGTLENAGSLSLAYGGQNYGSLVNDATGTVSIGATGNEFYDAGSIANSGTIDVLPGATLFNNGGSITELGTGTIKLECGATYTADSEATYTGAAPVDACHEPTITAKLSSKKPRSKAGWYRTAVTVTYTCKAGGAAINSQGCPSAVTVTAQGKGRKVARTVTDTDSGSATSTVTLNIDKTAPKVKIHGAVTGKRYAKRRHVTCSATDALSGVAGRCKVTHVHRARNGRVSYVATATDRAGNVTRKTGHYTINK